MLFSGSDTGDGVVFLAIAFPFLFSFCILFLLEFRLSLDSVSVHRSCTGWIEALDVGGAVWRSVLLLELINSSNTIRKE